MLGVSENSGVVMASLPRLTPEPSEFQVEPLLNDTVSWCSAMLLSVSSLAVEPVRIESLADWIVAPRGTWPAPLPNRLSKLISPWLKGEPSATNVVLGARPCAVLGLAASIKV